MSHDLDVVEYVSDRALVMYLGQVVESCASDERSSLETASVVSHQFSVARL